MRVRRIGTGVYVEVDIPSIIAGIRRKYAAARCVLHHTDATEINITID
jgi:hypothetical protein